MRTDGRSSFLAIGLSGAGLSAPTILHPMRSLETASGYMPFAVWRKACVARDLGHLMEPLLSKLSSDFDFGD
jgi:hypothetical protein